MEAEKKSFSLFKHKKPKGKVRKTIEWVLFSIFLLIFGFIVAGNISSMIHKKENFGAPIRFGVGTFIVRTSSMEPAYQVGSSLFTYKEEVSDVYNKFNKGQVVDLTFFNRYPGYVLDDADIVTEEFKSVNGGEAIVTNEVMTHRLREMKIDTSKKLGQGRYIFITSGINPKGKASHPGQYQTFTEVEYLGTVVYHSVFIGNVFDFISSAGGLIVLLLLPAAYLIISSGIDIFKALKEEEKAEENGATNSNSNIDSNNKISSLSEKDKERLKQELLEEMMNKKVGDHKDV